MGTGKVAINPDMVKWARDRASLKLADLEKAFPKIRDWEKGEDRPTVSQLEAYAKKTVLPIGLFFLPEIPDEEIAVTDFRTIQNKRVKKKISVELRETLYTMETRQDWMRDYLVSTGADKISLVGSISESEPPIKVAEKVFELLRLPPGWQLRKAEPADVMATLTERIEGLGILVMQNSMLGANTKRPLQVKEFRGFALIDDYAPLIFVNTNDYEPSRIFTIVHEFVHVLIGKGGISGAYKFNTRNETERFCNAVAGEVLAPEGVVRQLIDGLGKLDELRVFQEVARRLKVSGPVVAIQARRHSLAENSVVRKYLELNKNNTAAKKYGRGNYYKLSIKRLGKRFSETVNSAVMSGDMLHTEAYQLTGISDVNFDKFRKELRSF